MANPIDLENKQPVVITPDDARECIKFFQFFEIPISAGLQKSFDDFIREPNFQHQNEMKYQLAVVIINGGHPVFQDEVFNQVRAEVKEVGDELEFERRLEAELSENK